jgi:hypothetical protein
METVMLSRIAMATAFMLALVAPALADSSSCSEPYPPTAIDGNTVTMDQLKAAAHDANLFIKASDEYQTCLTADYAAQQEAAAKSKDKKPLDPSIKADVEAKIAANQKEKEKVGNEFQTALNAYKAKHPEQKP